MCGVDVACNVQLYRVLCVVGSEEYDMWLEYNVHCVVFSVNCLLCSVKYVVSSV